MIRVDTELTRLSNLPVGLEATVCRLDNNHELVVRLRAMGIKPGGHVRVMRCSPLRGPLQIRAGQTDIILRRDEAAAIHVSPIL